MQPVNSVSGPIIAAEGKQTFRKDGMRTGFLVRGISRKAAGSGRSVRWQTSEEVYSDPMDCLMQMRDILIPDRLREKTGLSDCADLTVLLDSCGYVVSFIADELLGCIDQCLKSGGCSPDDLARIRKLYNSLQGFGDTLGHRVSSWKYCQIEPGFHAGSAGSDSVSAPRFRYRIQPGMITTAAAI
jgi:hypothetical protein